MEIIYLVICTLSLLIGFALGVLSTLIIIKFILKDKNIQQLETRQQTVPVDSNSVVYMTDKREKEIEDNQESI